MTDPKKSYEALRDHYEDCLAKHGDTHRGVDWPAEADTLKRHRVMSCFLRGRDVSILDFGCGAGHFLDFLRADPAFAKVRYTGLDISDKFVSLCESKYPDQEFLRADILSEPFDRKFDFIVANGVFTVRAGISVPEMTDFFRSSIERLFGFANRGIAFNTMSKQVDWEREDLHHVSFDELGSYLTAHLSRHFTFHHDYGLYEFTTYVGKEADTFRGVP
jgi:SAM-dependent methyltransferase